MYCYLNENLVYYRQALSKIAEPLPENPLDWQLMTLNENIPRHEQISNWLREAIEKGDYEPLDRLPSESELGEQFDVSRVTVRHALQTLETEGLIHRRQGLGSFVSKRRVEQSLIHLHDFAEELARSGLASSSRLICFEQEECPGEIASILELEKGSALVRLERVRLAEGREVAYDITWLPMFYGQLLDGHDLEKNTIYGILEKEYQVPILNGRYTLGAENAGERLSRHLCVDEGAALLLIDRLSCTTAQKKVYYQKRYYRPDRLTYEIFLERTEEDWEEDRSDGPFPLKKFVPVFRSG